MRIKPSGEDPPVAWRGMTIMRNVTVRLGAVLLMAAAGVAASHATSLAEPETATESPAESPAPSPTENASGPSADAPKKSATGGHEVTYTITATSDLTGNISYIKTDPPSMSAYNANSSEYLETVRVPIGGGQPVVYTTTLADPGQWALVTSAVTSPRCRATSARRLAPRRSTARPTDPRHDRGIDARLRNFLIKRLKD